MLVTATRSTPRAERADRDDLVAVDDPAVRVHGEHAVAVAVEGDAEIVAPARTVACSIARSVAPQPTLMFDPSGSLATAVTSAPSRSKMPGAMRENAPFAQSTAILSPPRSEPKCSSTWST